MMQQIPSQAERHWNKTSTSLHLFILSVSLSIGCHQDSWTRIKSTTQTKNMAAEAYAQSQLQRADGVCLAKVVRIVEKNEMPSDGDHFQEVWIEPIHSSGRIPDWIRVIIQHGGNMPLESIQELSESMKTRLINEQSLQPNQRHWFLFSDDYDSSKYPYRVAGWWPHRSDTVPRAIIDAIEDDQLREARIWDPTLDLLAIWQSQLPTSSISIRSANSDNQTMVPLQLSVQGEIQEVHFYHQPFSYEMRWPESADMHVIHIETRRTFSASNDYNLPPTTYRVNLAFDPTNGKRIAEWIAADQEIWLMKAFRQFNPENGKLTQEIRFELLEQGGLEAGADTDHWYRKTLTVYDDAGDTSVRTYRHEYIKTGAEPVYSSTHWLPVDQDIGTTPP